MSGVSLKHITKRYTAGPPVLDDISLEIESGELFFLLGPSGCGKTTLLRILAGFLVPDSGEVFVAGKDVTKMPANKRNTGLVFQNYALWPHMTVAENVSFGLEVRGIPKPDMQRQVTEALALVGLEAYAERKIPALSGGQQQRVALARAIVIRPQLLLLDEPLSNLDAKLRLTMRSEIRRVCKESGLTGIYVTHDQKEALSMADRMAVLHQGRLCQVGSPREVYRRPRSRFVADFIGESNFVDATVLRAEKDGKSWRVETSIGHLQATSSDGKPFKDGERGIVGVRPESWLMEATIGTVRAGTESETAPDRAALPINAVEGRILSSTYLGESAQYEVKVGPETLTVLELRPPPRSVGDMVRLTAALDDVILLRAE